MECLHFQSFALSPSWGPPFPAPHVLFVCEKPDSQTTVAIASWACNLVGLTSVKAMAATVAWRFASTATIVPRALAFEALNSQGAAAQNMRSCSSGPSLREIAIGRLRGLNRHRCRQVYAFPESVHISHDLEPSSIQDDVLLTHGAIA